MRLLVILSPTDKWGQRQNILSFGNFSRGLCVNSLERQLKGG